MWNILQVHINLQSLGHIHHYTSHLQCIIIYINKTVPRTSKIKFKKHDYDIVGMLTKPDWFKEIFNRYSFFCISLETLFCKILKNIYFLKIKYLTGSMSTTLWCCSRMGFIPTTRSDTFRSPSKKWGNEKITGAPSYWQKEREGVSC